MNLTSVKPGDMVRVDKKGRLFHALVTDKEDGSLRIRAIERGNTWTTATAREVVGIWHKSRQKSRPKKPLETKELACQ